jgi:NitT/TauT family transport system substrate-binding protein
MPLKLVMVGQKKGVYFLIARPEIKDVRDLKGKTLGVSTMRGTDHLVTEELLRSKGVNPSLVRAVALGDTAVRAQSVAAGVVQAVTVSPPHDLTLQKMGFNVLAGPPAVGLPASGLFTSDRLIQENPQLVRRTLRALMKANRFIAENRDETIRVLLHWIPQTQEIAARSYDLELKGTTKDGQMTDAEVEGLSERLGDKKKPLDEIRDFSHVRQALKELAAK